MNQGPHPPVLEPTFPLLPMIQLQSKLAADLAVGGKAAVCNALQQAVELEHSTIPLYLYSLYSLDRNSNREISDILQSVVVEEMLHMTPPFLSS